MPRQPRGTVREAAAPYSTATKEAEETELLTKEEVGAELGVSGSFIFHEYQLGKIAGTKLSERKLRFTRAAVDAYQNRDKAGLGASSQAAPSPIARANSHSAPPPAQVPRGTQARPRQIIPRDSIPQLVEDLRALAARADKLGLPNTSIDIEMAADRAASAQEN